MNEENELRGALREILLELYNLTSERPVQQRRRTPVRENRRLGAVGATFTKGSAPRPARFTRESSAIPGRRAILVGSSVRRADKARSAKTGARFPGESDRDFVDRRSRVRRAHAIGLAPPKGDTTPTFHREAWEMGH